MENPEGVLNLLDEFAKLKSKEIPNDLEEYLLYVAASGDPVYQWSLIKSLYRQKLINVITEFYEMCPVLDIPRCPNVDPFNYETMKNSLLKRLDSFSSAPFTIQRISELLTTPRKQYNRVDKFMRAIEKNIWVVSTREPGPREPPSTQETSTNLVNGVTPRVCVTVKHPKRVKSIEERIKSGHPQLIDDDEDEEEEEEEEMDEYEQMEEESTAEILPNSDTDDTSLQCTSVKNLIEKYENGTIFSNSEEKTDFEEKSVHLEEVSAESTPQPAPTSEAEAESESTESVPPTSELSSVEDESASTAISTSATTTVVDTTPAELNSDITSVVDTDTTTTTTTTSAAADAVPDSVEESTPETFFNEPEKETVEPMVAADSSSDLPVQDSEMEVVEAEEVATLDSTSDISVEEPQPMAESSASSSTEMSVCENEVVPDVVNRQAEPSTSDISSDVVDSEFHPAPEPSSDSESEVHTKDPDTVNETTQNECV